MLAVTDVEETTSVDLGALLNAGDGAVVTLVAGDTRLAVHRAVLAARSPVFAKMFQHDTLESHSGQITISDVEGPVLRQLVAYCCTLQTPHLPCMAPQLLAAAGQYGLSALKGLCGQQVASQLDVEKTGATAALAGRQACPGLTEAAVASTEVNRLQVVATQGRADAVGSQREDATAAAGPLAETSPEARTPATAKGATAPSSHHQPHSGHGHHAPAAAELPTAPHHSPAPHGADLSWIWTLSAKERDRKLIHAAQQGAVGELQALLAAGVDVGTRDKYRQTALHWAAERGHLEAARCLVGGGAEADARNSWQRTPLHLASLWGHAAVVRLLLRASGDPNARDQWGTTPLHWAAVNGRAEVAAALLEAGANKLTRDDQGNTPLDLARQNNKQEVVLMLT